MTVLHMETEAVREIAAQLNQIAEMIRGEVQSATQTSVSVNWEGPNRDQFVMEVGIIARQIEGLTQQAEQLSARATHEVEEWEQAASSLGGDVGFPSITLPFPMPMPGPLPIMPMPIPGSTPEPSPAPIPIMPLPITDEPNSTIELFANDFNTKP